MRLQELKEDQAKKSMKSEHSTTASKKKSNPMNEYYPHSLSYKKTDSPYNKFQPMKISSPTSRKKYYNSNNSTTNSTPFARKKRKK